MEMNKANNEPVQLPIYGIEGVPFLVDVDLALMRHAKDPLNFIEFSDMIDKGTHYETYFDPKTETADVYSEKPRGLVKVKIPQMVVLDPERVALKYNVKVSELPAKDSELRTSREWYKLRKMGKQPTIRVLGEEYVANMRMQVLEPMNLCNDFLMLSAMKPDPTRTFYYGLLDTETMSLIAYDEKQIKALPENAVIIRIPHERVLDPYLQIWQMGWEDHPERLGKFPIRYNFEALVLDVKDTPIAACLKANQKRKIVTHRKGKGL